MGQVILNIASTYPYATFIPDEIITWALKTGFDGISMLPTWIEPNPQYLDKIKYIEKPWNPGDPWQYIKGWWTEDPYAPKLHDVVLFPWYKKWWNPQIENYLQHGTTPIVHDIGSLGIVEISPKIQMPGIDIIAYMKGTKRSICVDSYHAVREAWESERKPGESLNSDLGDWKPWVANAAEAGILSIVDLHPQTARLENMDFGFPMKMLRHAIAYGFTGDVRVEITLPLTQQLFKYKEACIRALQEIKFVMQ